MSDDPAIILRERIARGEAAQELLTSVVLEQALDQLEADAILSWKTALGPAQLATREAAHATVRGIDQIRGQLKAWHAEGEHAREQLTELTDDDEQE